MTLPTAGPEGQEDRTRTLNWRDLSGMVYPSAESKDIEHAWVPGQRHCFSIQGLAYVSTLLHTCSGAHWDSSCSERICGSRRKTKSKGEIKKEM